MQIGKFTFKNRKWFYNDRELANPILIIWQLMFYIPLFISLGLFSLMAGLFEFNIGTIKRTWQNNA